MTPELDDGPRRLWVAEIPSVASVDALHEALQYALKLPGWYGRNWDAFEECVHNLDHLGVDEVVITHISPPEIPPDALRTYREILSERAEARITPAFRWRVKIPGQLS